MSVATVREYVSKSGATSWQVHYRDGKIQTSKTFDNAEEAEDLKTLINQFGVAAGLKLAGEQIKHRNALTLDKLANLWFDVRERDVVAGKITERTLRDYRRDYRLWIQEPFAQRAAAGITTEDVADWIDEMIPMLSGKRVNDMHGLLFSIFKWAASPLRNHVPDNPCVHTENLPSRDKKPPKGLRLPELHALLEAARGYSIEAHDLIAFLAGTGWRLGEAVALTAGQVEDDGTNVYVTVDRVFRRGQGIVVDEAKSHAGLRRLRVLGDAVDVLRRRVKNLDYGDLVFTTQKRRAWEDSTFRHHYWTPIVKLANLSERGPTPHWLRHTHVFVCHAAGLSIAEISRRLGHADIKLTINTYGRLIDDMSDDVAKRLDALLKPGSLNHLVLGEVIDVVDEPTLAPAPAAPVAPALPENVALALAQAVAAGTMAPEQLAAMLAGAQAPRRAPDPRRARRLSPQLRPSAGPSSG